MIDTAMVCELIELVSQNFKTEEINEIGTRLFPKFDLYGISGTRHTQTINSRRASIILLDYCKEKKQEIKLIEFLIQLDGVPFWGRDLDIAGLETFMEKLSQAGSVYDPHKRKIVALKDSMTDSPNWGVLKENKQYPISVLSIDIAGNSELIKKYGDSKMQKLYALLWARVKSKLHSYKGRIWSWAGDGGIIAFAFRGNPWNSVKFAIEIQAALPLFYFGPSYPIADPIELRIGIDFGKIKFRGETGSIISEAINYASHLEKQVCAPGKIAISEVVYKEIGKAADSFFEKHSVFEGRQCYLSRKRIDSLIR